jgi:tetratricopeptide (TPR) repeat protein
MKVAVATIWKDATSGAFDEVREILKCGLEALGHEVTLLDPNTYAEDRTNIVLGGHLLPYVDVARPPQGSILYSLEQVGSRWMRGLPAIFRSFRVWDYDPGSTAVLRQAGVDVRLVPLGYVPQLTRIARHVDEDIDVLFFGALNARRRQALDNLRLRGLHVVSLEKCYGERRDELIARSKVVLNLHYYDPGVFEVVRVLYLMANRTCVVSEDGSGSDPFREGVAFGRYEDLAELCVRFVRDPSGRHQLAEAGLKLAQARPATRFFQAALIEVGAEEPSPITDTGGAAAGYRARVSLSMIVKNESAHLDACLESAKHLVDEIVVVDTGSTDDTPDIARRHGAQVHEFPWCDDFAAARNEAIRHASGDWILWLDADDRIPPRSQDELRQLLKGLTDENVAYLMTVLCPAPDGGPMSQVPHARLFRNRPEIRWEHRVHEQIVRSIERSGGRMAPTDISIVHIGYMQRAAMNGKLERNLRLVELDLEERPFDLGLLQARAVTLLGLGRSAEALVTLNICEPGVALEEFARNIYALRAEAYAAQGLPQEALEAARAGLARSPRDSRLAFVEAQILAALGRLAEAEASLRGQLMVGEEHGKFASADRTIAGFRARHLLAEVLLQKGAPELAEAESRAVVEARPSFGQAWLTLGEALIEQGKFEALDALVSGLGTSSDADTGRTSLSALRCLRDGDVLQASSLVNERLARNPQDVILLRTKARLLAASGTLGDELAAIARTILESDPLCARTSSILRNAALANLSRSKPETWSDRAKRALNPLVDVK